MIYSSTQQVFSETSYESDIVLLVWTQQRQTPLPSSNGGLLNQRQFSKVLLMYKNIKHFLHPHLKHIVLNGLKRGLWGRALTPLNLRLESWVLTQQSSAWRQVWFHFQHSVLTCSKSTMHTKWCKSISSDKCLCFFFLTCLQQSFVN